jgi:hypothetical protein
MNFKVGDIIRLVTNTAIWESGHVFENNQTTQANSIVIREFLDGVDVLSLDFLLWSSRQHDEDEEYPYKLITITSIPYNLLIDIESEYQYHLLAEEPLFYVKQNIVHIPISDEFLELENDELLDSKNGFYNYVSEKLVEVNYPELLI